MLRYAGALIPMGVSPRRAMKSFDPLIKLPAMKDRFHPDSSIGECSMCVHCRRITSPRGSLFFMCQRAETDERFVRYPALPVWNCPGFDREEEK